MNRDDRNIQAKIGDKIAFKGLVSGALIHVELISKIMGKFNSRVINIYVSEKASFNKIGDIMDIDTGIITWWFIEEPKKSTAICVCPMTWMGITHKDDCPEK